MKRLGSFCTKIGTGATPHGGSEVYLDSRISHALSAANTSSSVISAQPHFTDIAKPIFDRINRNAEQSRILATRRDTLLPKLPNGELSVPGKSA